MGLREYERSIPVPTISEISKQGTISISWNVEMEVPQNLTELFSTSSGRRLQEGSALEISLIEGEETELQALETENIFIKSFTARQLEIQIDFVQPELVSRSDAKDHVTVNFTQAAAFKSAYGIQMSPNTTVLKQDIPKQFAKDAIIVELGSAPMVLLNAQFCIQFFFKALMNSILGVI